MNKILLYIIIFIICIISVLGLNNSKKLMNADFEITNPGEGQTICVIDTFL